MYGCRLATEMRSLLLLFFLALGQLGRLERYGMQQAHTLLTFFFFSLHAVLLPEPSDENAESLFIFLPASHFSLSLAHAKKRCSGASCHMGPGSPCRKVCEARAKALSATYATRKNCHEIAVGPKTYARLHFMKIVADAAYFISHVISQQCLPVKGTR